MGENVGPPGSTECNLATSREGVFMYSRMWDQGGSPLKTCKRDAVWFCAKPLTRKYWLSLRRDCEVGRRRGELPEGLHRVWD